MPVVLTLIKTKQIRINIHKRNTVNTSTHVTKHPHIAKPPTYT